MISIRDFKHSLRGTMLGRLWRKSYRHKKNSSIPATFNQPKVELFNKGELYFLVHIMKTGGTTLRSMLKPYVVNTLDEYPAKKDYEKLPDIEEASALPYIDIDQLRRLSEERKKNLKFLSGHFPFCVGELFSRPVRYLSFFRHPVERTISHLKQSRTRQPGYIGMDLEQIYENEQHFDMFIRDFQTRHFAHELTDNLKMVFDPNSLTAVDFARAQERVAQLDFIGIQEDYDGSIAKLREQYQLPMGKIKTVTFRSDDCPIPAGLPERIARDNPYDMQMYEFVKELYYKRRGQSCRRAA